MQKINYLELEIGITDSIKGIALKKAAELRGHKESNRYIDCYISLTDAEVKEINDWLNKSNLPNLDYAVIFQKKNMPVEGDDMHIDYDSSNGELSKAALNLPIQSCRGTKMLWWTGDYTYQEKFVNNKDQVSLEKNEEFYIPFAEITWHGKPELHDVYHTGEKPFIARVDIPHNVTAFSDLRIILSLRLQGNPSVKELRDRMTEIGL